MNMSLFCVERRISLKLQRWFSVTSYQLVSRDSNTKTDEIKLYFHQQNIQFADTWTCFQCPNEFQVFQLQKEKSRTLTMHNLNNYYVNKTTGDYTCPRNGHHGTWNEFKTFSGNIKPAKRNSPIDTSTECFDKMDKSCIDIYNASTPITDLDFEYLDFLMGKFYLRGMDVRKLSNFDIRCNKVTDEIIVPYWSIALDEKCLLGVKTIHNGTYCSKDCSVTDSQSQPSFSIKSQRKRCLNFFGMQPSFFKESCIVITANEFDAIAINSLTQTYCAVALPYGTSSLPLNLLPYVECFPDIVLWFGTDLLSVEATKSFSEKLNRSRCRVIRPPHAIPTAVHALKQDVDIDSLIRNAVSTQIRNIITFSDLRNEIKDELLNKEKYAGVPYRRFKNLNQKIKGHRRGELSVLTGPTGAGKTTLLSELSLDLAMQGVRTLWGSFEIGNKQLLISMFKQFSRDFIHQDITKFEDIASKFQELPLTLMTYNGPKNIADIIKTMYEVTYSKDIRHIIIDNLQFIIGSEMRSDRFVYQDYVISKFREFASVYHVHITVVVHPRKEDQNLPIQLSSVFGSAKVTQEADNVFILQQTKLIKSGNDFPIIAKYLEIAKNRYDGELGRIKLYFDKNTRCMSPNPSQVT